MKAKLLFNSALLCFLFLSPVSKAQECLMAKGNKILTISYGITNIERSVLNSYMQRVESEDAGSYQYNYSIKYTNPLSASFDLATSDFTTVGIGLNYFGYNMSETRTGAKDTSSLSNKGYRMAIQLRGIRYIVQRPRSLFYLFAGAGIRMRKNRYSTSDAYVLNVMDIQQTPGTTYNGFSPWSLDAGLGLKFLIAGNVGFSAEAGAVTGIARFGLFYSFLNKWRRNRDNIGW
ncbi:MAG TPA: hypothetical protein PLP34_06850, partial [Chitinophagaceae bacterium]|nr:hypothetical protein [Chitinophagaceae bacterium]